VDRPNIENIEKKAEIQPSIEQADLKVEKIKAPEAGVEAKEGGWPEKNQPAGGEKLPQGIEELNRKATVGAPGIDTTDSPLHQEVESILQDGLEDMYFSMSPEQQEKFKQKGEQAASQIVNLIQTAKVTFNKIFKLILSWLRFIPGINKYYLEQEAKIKADKILEIDSSNK